MRRYILFFGILGLVASQCFAGAWDTLYTSRLNDSSSYLEAKINLKAAQVDYDAYVKPFVPSISITTNSTSDSTYNSGISFGSDISSGGSLTPTVTFEKIVAGADLTLQTPINFSTSNSVSIGNPSVSISRSLFPETEADRLEAEAKLLAAQASIQKVQDDLKVSLASDILDAVYYQKKLKADQENLEVLQEVRAATVDTTKFHELDKNILSAQKSILEATNYLSNIKDDVKNNAEALYEDLIRLKDGWLASQRGEQPTTSKTIHSIELSLNAAELKGKSTILAYLPNPTLTGSVYYDTDKNKMGWGLTIKLSYNVLNKGANSLNAMKREEYPKLYTSKLKDAQDELKNTLGKISEAMKTLDLDKKIKDIDIADAQDAAAKQESLYKSGFISQEDYITARINLNTLQLDSQKIDYDILIQQLKLAQLYDEAN